MEYELRHNNDVVVIVNVNDNFRVDRISKPYINTEKLPVGLLQHDGQNIDTHEFNEWILSRGIPAKRENADYIFDKENVNSARELVFKNDGLSMTDHYWIVPKNSQLRWENVNYFDNDIDFGKHGDAIYLGKDEEIIADGRTPSSSASGMQPKIWVIHENQRWMLKSSEEATKQEPYSEVAASLFLDRLNVGHVCYRLFDREDETLSGCPNMLDNRHELISAFYVSSNKRGNNESVYEHYIRSCQNLGVKGDIRTLLEQMIAIDYLIANTDRHWSNFAVIRNADDFSDACLAPLYDHGAAFYTKLHHLEIEPKNRYLECRSFKRKQSDNIKLVRNIDWLDRDVLKDLPELVFEILSKNKFNPPGRVDIIVDSIRSRIEEFKRVMGFSFDVPVSVSVKR